MFGKTLGNGYAINAVVGKKEVMEAAQETFISSTFWTERIGPVAALATLKEMERLKSWEEVTEIGKKVQKGWLQLAKNHGLKINLYGIPALATYSFEGTNALAYKTLVSQEMLAKGFLASTAFYASVCHNDKIIEKYFNVLDSIYKTISDCENEKLNIKDLLKGPICHSGFQRLN